MKITLVQSQIEEAIRNYAMERIRLQPGQRLDLNLMATRGPAGYTCDIEVVDDTTGQALNIAQKVESARSALDTQEAVEAPVESDTAEEVAETVEAQDDVQEPAQDAEEADESTDEAPAEDKPARPSIFAKLEKPKNAPTPKPETKPSANDGAGDEAAA